LLEVVPQGNFGNNGVAFLVGVCDLSLVTLAAFS
jgi:hypothetical protein